MAEIRLDESDVDEITTKVCDTICKWTTRGLTQDELDIICKKCPMKDLQDRIFMKAMNEGCN